jgi:hypothetical protein
VRRERWQPIVLSWATWASAGDESLQLVAQSQPVA